MAENRSPPSRRRKYRRSASNRGPVICIAPQFVAEELLHAEGFTDIRYVDFGQASPTQKLARDEVDWTLEFAPAMIEELDGGAPVTMVAGVHVGCFELFAHEHIRGVADLKGRTVGVASGLRDTEASGEHHGELCRPRPG